MKKKKKKKKKKTDAKWLYVYWKEENVTISFFCNLKQNFTNVVNYSELQKSRTLKAAKFWKPYNKTLL